MINVNTIPEYVPILSDLNNTRSDVLYLKSVEDQYSFQNRTYIYFVADDILIQIRDNLHVYHKNYQVLNYEVKYTNKPNIILNDKPLEIFNNSDDL